LLGKQGDGKKTEKEKDDCTFHGTCPRLYRYNLARNLKSACANVQIWKCANSFVSAGSIHGKVLFHPVDKAAHIPYFASRPARRICFRRSRRDSRLPMLPSLVLHHLLKHPFIFTDGPGKFFLRFFIGRFRFKELFLIRIGFRSCQRKFQLFFFCF